MKVLDLFCGLGGWSVPFVEDGDEVIGVDHVKFKRYPGQQIVMDIMDLDGTRFRGMDLIIGSPPCDNFTKMKNIYNGTPRARDVEAGLRLIREYERIVAEAEPRYWLMENVKNLSIQGWYKRKPIWTFRISKQGYRNLWGNITMPSINPTFNNGRRLSSRYGGKESAQRAKIPYKVARYVADCVKELGDGHAGI